MITFYEPSAMVVLEKTKLVGSLKHGTLTKLVYFEFAGFHEEKQLWSFPWKLCVWQNPYKNHKNQSKRLELPRDYLAI